MALEETVLQFTSGGGVNSNYLQATATLSHGAYTIKISGAFRYRSGAGGVGGYAPVNFAQSFSSIQPDNTNTWLLTVAVNYLTGAVVTTITENPAVTTGPIAATGNNVNIAWQYVGVVAAAYPDAQGNWTWIPQ